MSKKTKTIIAIVALLAIAGFIGQAIEGKKEEPKMNEVKLKSNSPSRIEAYIIAKQFAKEHLGSADYGVGDNGFTDYGDSTYHVSGVADIPGKRIRWTVELKYKGGDVYYKDNWMEKGWIAE